MLPYEKLHSTFFHRGAILALITYKFYRNFFYSAFCFIGHAYGYRRLERLTALWGYVRGICHTRKEPSSLTSNLGKHRRGGFHIRP